jgi:hypothetical protein
MFLNESVTDESSIVITISYSISGIEDSAQLNE